MDHKDPGNGVPGLPDEPTGGVTDAAGASGALGTSGPDDGTMPLPRVQRQPLAAAEAVGTGGVGGTGGAGGTGKTPRVVQLVAGDYLLTLNPVDGTEITVCPAGDRPTTVRRTARERAAVQDHARPPAPAGPRGPELPLLERDEDRERLHRLLARGRSVRVTGPSGAGRSVLLDAVAEACADLAPDGVIRLSGYRRTPSDLLQELFAVVHRTETEGAIYRPSRHRLLDGLREVGAVVVVDDLEFGASALEEMLAAAPECAFLMSATPDVPAPSPDSAVEELFLPGLTRIACLELLELAVERPLEDEEAAWAADLWFESEGLPLRFVQAGALLRRRDALGLEVLRGDEPVWGEPADAAPADDVGSAAHVPLPSLAESAAPAELLVSSMGESARETLLFAVALGGELPNQAHLPALVGDTHGDAALGSLVNAGLAVPVASHYRLASGVRQQLIAPSAAAAPSGVPGVPGGPGGASGPVTSTSTSTDSVSAAHAHTAAQHYSWWAGHPSVTPERVAAESEVILAAIAACRDGGHASAAVLLARTAAPAFAAALHWSAWERSLRAGQEAARQAGEVAEEAYFHHELGVLALCTGSLDRARTELEASIALRGAVADRAGTTVGRRTLALVVDRSGSLSPVTTPLGVEFPGFGTDVSELPGAAYHGDDAATVISKRLTVSGPAPAPSGSRRLHALTSSRRHLAAVGAGALLAAVLGTIVTLGTTANSGDTNTPMNVKPIESAQQNEADNGLPAASDTAGSTQRPNPSDSGTSPGATTSAEATDRLGGVTTDPGTTGSASSGTSTASATTRPSATSHPTSPKPSHTSASPSGSGSASASPSGSASSSASPSSSSSSPSTSDSASASVSTSPVAGSEPAAPSDSTAAVPIA